jgi:hypothetical protein
MPETVELLRVTYAQNKKAFISGLHRGDQFHRLPLYFHRTSQLTRTASLSLGRIG